MLASAAVSLGVSRAASLALPASRQELPPGTRPVMSRTERRRRCASGGYLRGVNSPLLPAREKRETAVPLLSERVPQLLPGAPGGRCFRVRLGCAAPCRRGGEPQLGLWPHGGAEGQNGTPDCEARPALRAQQLSSTRPLKPPGSCIIAHPSGERIYHPPLT